MQYFELIVQQTKQNGMHRGKHYFSLMPNDYRKKFIESINGNWNSGLDEIQKHLFADHQKTIRLIELDTIVKDCLYDNSVKSAAAWTRARKEIERLGGHNKQLF